MKFQDRHLAALNLFDPNTIVLLVGYLRGDIIATGDPKEESDYLSRHAIYLDQLNRILKQNQRLTYVQLNEVFLVLDKNRISKGFFSFFFIPPEAITADPDMKKHPRKYYVDRDQLREGVTKFRGLAMLRYGNFRHAFKKLRELEFDEIVGELRPWTNSVTYLTKRYADRVPKTVDIEKIRRENTWFTGYVMAQYLLKDTELIWSAYWRLRKSDYEKLMTKDRLHKYKFTQQEIESKASLLSSQQLALWDRSLSQLIDQCQELQIRYAETIETATRNLDTYLTWDYMDVYVATSMRETWEFEAVCDFVDSVLESEKLKELNLRYFDPTQSYTEERLNKGLVESLVLKRSAVTIYLVQEMDTLGKDSELAATLAQGKPVIAFIPKISESQIPKLAKDLESRPLRYFHQRFYYLHSESPNLRPEVLKLLTKILGSEARVNETKDKIKLNLAEFFNAPRLNTIKIDEEAFKAEPSNDFKSICLYMAATEKLAYDRRAEILKSYHPLAMQVSLSDGVAHGILVARDYTECSDLIRRLLLNELEFDIECESDCEEGQNILDSAITQLRESQSGCPFRVVTGHKKITNSFWNFYLKAKGD